jgi:hypothetical protein
MSSCIPSEKNVEFSLLSLRLVNGSTATDFSWAAIAGGSLAR